MICLTCKIVDVLRCGALIKLIGGYKILLEFYYNNATITMP